MTNRPGIALFTVLLCSLFVNTADAHLTRDQAACFKRGIPREVPTSKTDSLPNGLIVESYDTDRNGKADLVTLSHSDVKGHKPFPTFYVLDFDEDGQVDSIYIDKEGLGFCDDIVLYEDLGMPHDTGVNFQDQTQTDKGRDI